MILLEKTALRIRARAIERCGELLKEIPKERAGQKIGRGDDPPSNSPRQEAARSAGLSRDQAKTAIRVANVPKGDFERLVESPMPPTVSELAERGKRPAPQPIGKPKGVKPAPILSVAAVLLQVHRGHGEQRVSLRHMGERLGVSREFVRALLAGEKYPGLDLAILVEEAYGIAPRDWKRVAKPDCQLPVDETGLHVADEVPTIRSEVAS